MFAFIILIILLSEERIQEYETRIAGYDTMLKKIAEINEIHLYYEAYAIGGLEVDVTRSNGQSYKRIVNSCETGRIA